MQPICLCADNFSFILQFTKPFSIEKSKNFTISVGELKHPLENLNIPLDWPVCILTGWRGNLYAIPRTFYHDGGKDNINPAPLYVNGAIRAHAHIDYLGEGDIDFDRIFKTLRNWLQPAG